MPKAVASTASAKARVAQAENSETQGANPAGEIRTAYSASSQPKSDNGLLAGAAPVVPVGTFDSRWSALR